MGQFLTAVFEMRPTRRKAAALERVRAANEEAFWEAMEGARDQAAVLTPFDATAKRRVDGH